ncbi:oocyte zinc finger protein XlCOF29-like [Salvelinus namaycush]|uniref:Oocyte zinc finger protein XlCOF29-like n=1 Tax=Salvelinus namaycush TaxID=8040 RepID=A0A8U0QM43_SALNM|nr:oocyte zinc finger protein XlCOF29-like [Salvelinus namaycush]
MSKRASFHTQLSSIMEILSRTAMAHVCKLVDDEYAGISLENEALTDKLHNLESELTIVKSTAPKLAGNYRSVGVQTGETITRIDRGLNGSPTIEGIFGKEWCLDLWNHGDPYNTENSPQHIAKSTGAPSGQADVKEEDCEVEIINSRDQQERPTIILDGDDDLLDNGREGPSNEYPSFDSFRQDRPGRRDKQVLEMSTTDVSTGHTLRFISIDGVEEEYGEHVFPIEDDETNEFLPDDTELLPNEAQDEHITKPTYAKKSLAKSKSKAGKTAGKTFSYFNRFNLHSHSKSDTNKLSCVICKKTFLRQNHLTMHMKSHKSLYCSVCKNCYPGKTQLKKHKCVAPDYLASNSSKYFCHYCGKSFSCPSSLRIHHLVHTGERPHTCTVCGRGFTQKGNLKCHMRLHTGEKPFKCLTCEIGFTQKVYLTQHLAKAHGQKEDNKKKKAQVHKCSKCQLSFVNQQLLQTHMTVHKNK